MLRTEENEITSFSGTCASKMTHSFQCFPLPRPERRHWRLSSSRLTRHAGRLLRKQSNPCMARILFCRKRRAFFDRLKAQARRAGPSTSMASQKIPQIHRQLFLQLDQPLGDVLDPLLGRLILVQVLVQGLDPPCCSRRSSGLPIRLSLPSAARSRLVLAQDIPLATRGAAPCPSS